MAEQADLIDRMRQEEEALLLRPPLDLPISSGRMYMGPALTPAAEEAFLQMPSGTSLNLMPAPIGPPTGTIGVPTEAEELARLQTGDIPGFTKTVGFRRDVPMTMPEEPGAARFALLSEYQRLRSAGVPEADAASRLGLDYFMPQGRYGRLTPYQELSTGLRERQIRLAEEAQKERLARETRREAAVVAPGLEIKYKSLLTAAQKAAEGFDPDLQRSTQDALTAFERDHPEFFRRGEVAPSVVRPPAATGGRVRVKSPSGKFGFIPASQLRAALAQGYTQVK